MHRLEIDGLTVGVVRKKIKHLHLRVYPPDGRVCVSAPLHVSDEFVRRAVIERSGWIRRQQQRLERLAPPAAPAYAGGEVHAFRGVAYRLNVIEHDGPPRVDLRDGPCIDLVVRPGSTLEQRRKVLADWYRGQLQSTLPGLIEKWEPVLGVRVAGWSVRRMKTRWGSCSIQRRTIRINLELAKRSPACLEYVVVHEMLHLLERGHNARFRLLLDRYLPGWRALRDELNRPRLVGGEG